MIATCGTCKHWKPAAEDEYGSEVRANRMGLRKCGAVEMFDQSYRWRDDHDGDGGADDPSSALEFMPDCVNKTAFVQDGSSYRADLFTKSNHFCPMHEVTP